MVNDKNKVFLEKFLQNPALTKIIVDTVGTTISSFTKIAVTAGSPRLQTKRETKTLGAVAVVRLQGEKLSLELFLGLSKELTLAMASHVFNQNITDILTAQDLVGEILNIAFGTIDPLMSAQGFKMRSSFPQNFSGPRLVPLLKELPQEGIVVPFSAAGEEFFLEILAPESLQKKWTYTP